MPAVWVELGALIGDGIFFLLDQDSAYKYKDYRNPEHDPGIRKRILTLTDLPNIYDAHETDPYPKTDGPLELSFAFIHHDFILILIKNIVAVRPP
ncbi:MAG: hypothetical protein WB421_20155, partial [Terriglobales bacterium]